MRSWSNGSFGLGNSRWGLKQLIPSDNKKIQQNSKNEHWDF